MIPFAVSILVQNLSVLVLAGFTGYLVISKVPNTLHTPLMSGTNAVHGIVVLGGIIVLGLGVEGWFTKLLLVIAIIFGTINVVGGFLVTDRMLEMFKSKPKPRADAEAPAAADRHGGSATGERLGPGGGGATPGGGTVSGGEGQSRSGGAHDGGQP
jgi:H+-translocating NAD(P) transhydrogenase subunit alpha